MVMSNYYLGDPCYVIPDAEWDDFCQIMNYDGDDFDFKNETCRVIGTGGDGDFGGLSVDAGIIGVIPVALCDPQKLKSYVPSDARLINNSLLLKMMDGAILSLLMEKPSMVINVNVGIVEGMGSWYSEDNMVDCDSCGSMVGPDCVEYGDRGEYCSEWCKEEREAEEED